MTTEQFYEFLRKEGALKTFLREILDVHILPSGGRKKPSLRTYEIRIQDTLKKGDSPIDQLLLWCTTKNGQQYYSDLNWLFRGHIKAEEKEEDHDS